MRAVPTGHPPGLGHYGGAGTALTDLGGRDRLCVVRRWGTRGLPRSPGSTSSPWPGRKGPRARRCALRGVSSRPGPRRGAVAVPEQAAAAAIPEGGAARAPGTPAAAPGSPHSSEPVCAGPPGSLATMRLGTRLVGDVTTSQGRSRPRPRYGPGRCACAGLRWGASCTLGSVIPGMSLIRNFCHGEASPGPLIRSHSPGGLPPALSHADNSQGTRGGGRGRGSGHRP